MIALLVMTDGRPCVHQTIPSALANLQGPISELWIHDDSGFSKDRLKRPYRDWNIIGSPVGRQGFGGAIQYAWNTLRDNSTAEYIFHLEDDFLFNRTIDLDGFIAILEKYPELVQMALRRQPWNNLEIAAGGVVELHPDAYEDMETEVGEKTYQWLRHKLFFTTNPSLYRRSLILNNSWPGGDRSEGKFSIMMLEQGGEFGYWGRRSDAPWVEHIGMNRAGIGY
jgi:hypothetical protein